MAKNNKMFIGLIVVLLLIAVLRTGTIPFLGAVVADDGVVGASRHTPGTVNPGGSFDLTYILTGPQSGFGYSIIEDISSGCIPARFNKDGWCNSYYCDITTKVTAPDSGSCTFSGKIYLEAPGETLVTLPKTTVTVNTGSSCEASISNLKVSPTKVEVNKPVTISADITYKGTCTFQGGLGINMRYLDRDGNKNCADSSCLFSVITVEENKCDPGNSYYATVKDVFSNSWRTDTFNFVVTPTKQETFDVIVSAHEACKQAPISKEYIQAAFNTGCTYDPNNPECDEGSLACLRYTDGDECGVNQACKAGVCSVAYKCDPGEKSTKDCPSGEFRICFADGSGYGQCGGCSPGSVVTTNCPEGQERTCFADGTDYGECKEKVISLTCGNGDLDSGEECDGKDASSLEFWKGNQCNYLGRGDGDLTCKSDCTFDVSDCQFSVTQTCSLPEGMVCIPPNQQLDDASGANDYCASGWCSDIDGQESRGPLYNLAHKIRSELSGVESDLTGKCAKPGTILNGKFDKNQANAGSALCEYKAPASSGFSLDGCLINGSNGCIISMGVGLVLIFVVIGGMVLVSSLDRK